MIQNIQLTFSSINISAQVGDMVYYTGSSGVLGGFDNSVLTSTYMLGVITNISGNTITVQYDDTPPHPGPPQIGDFISFAKDKQVNTSSLLGYYASVNFVNNSPKKAELFAIGSEISESSK